MELQKPSLDTIRESDCDVSQMTKNKMLVDVLTNNEWASNLLVKFGTILPEAFASSIEVAEIVAESLPELNKDYGIAFSKQEEEELLLAAVLHDVGKMDHPELYQNNMRFRDDPLAKEHEIKELHPLNSYDKIIDHNPVVATIAGRHHSLKNENPYPRYLAKNSNKDSFILLASQIISVVDVSQALLGDQKQRQYRDETEISDNTLHTISVLLHHELAIENFPATDFLIRKTNEVLQRKKAVSKL